MNNCDCPWAGDMSDCLSKMTAKYGDEENIGQIKKGKHVIASSLVTHKIFTVWRVIIYQGKQK